MTKRVSRVAFPPGENLAEDRLRAAKLERPETRSTITERRGLDMSRVLLVEDDLQLGDALRQALSHAGFDAVWVRLAAQAREALERGGFAAMILDIQLPDGNGFDVLGDARRRGDTTPALFLTVRYDIADRVRGLDAGADDYLIKPFAVVELLARIRALIRRGAGQASSEWQVGNLRIAPDRREVWVGDHLLPLSPKEFTLLLELARQAGKVVTRAQLETVMLPAADVAGSNLLDVHVHNLRRKLGELSGAIRTVPGVGYMLNI
ncbi:MULTISPECIES: response regulator [unclassified Lysobacter]|uniref:response regulator n=1 Tax=unclassified Lysobacter TaxID=2635362 RepID=UPI001F578879|nr:MULTISPECIES: response regulator [unclassified Lysobacter]